MQFAVRLPNLNVDGARIPGKTTCMDSAFGANDVGFIVIARGMRPTEVKCDARSPKPRLGIRS
jgi:hypothetical protein